MTDTVEVDFLYLVRIRASLAAKDHYDKPRDTGDALLTEVAESLRESIVNDWPYEEPEEGDLVQQVIEADVTPCPSGWGALPGGDRAQQQLGY